MSLLEALGPVVSLKKNEDPGDRLGLMKIHLPRATDSTKSRRVECFDAIDGGAEKYFDMGVSSVLMTDHNTHGGYPMNLWHGKVIFQVGLDLIGARISMDGADVRRIKTKKIKSRIDGHWYIGALCLVTWPSGKRTKIWFVQANLGRGVSVAVFREEVLKIKRAFRGHLVLGFDEIDEADRPDEHAILREEFPQSKGWQYIGFPTYSPMIVSRKLRVTGDHFVKVSEGLTKVTPHRDLVFGMIRPPLSIRERIGR